MTDNDIKINQIVYGDEVKVFKNNLKSLSELYEKKIHIIHPVFKSFYYSTPIHNLCSILKFGIFSRNSMGSRTISGANSEVVKLRDKKVVNVEGEISFGHPIVKIYKPYEDCPSKFNFEYFKANDPGLYRLKEIVNHYHQEDNPDSREEGIIWKKWIDSPGKVVNIRNKTVNSFVPVYLIPDSPTFWTHKDNPEYCILKISTKIIKYSQAAIFTDGNAASANVSFFNKPSSLDQIPVDKLLIPNTNLHRFERNSEFLFYSSIPSDFIELIYFNTNRKSINQDNFFDSVHFDIFMSNEWREDWRDCIAFKDTPDLKSLLFLYDR